MACNRSRRQWRSQALQVGWAQGDWGKEVPYSEVQGRSPDGGLRAKPPEARQFDIDLATEFNLIKDWVARSHLKINTNKTKEIVLRKPTARYFHMPLLLDGVERVDSFKLLGLMFQNNFKFDAHVNFVVRQCSQRLYLLKLLRCQGMNNDHFGPGYSMPSLYLACAMHCLLLATDL